MKTRTAKIVMKGYCYPDFVTGKDSIPTSAIETVNNQSFGVVKMDRIMIGAVAQRMHLKLA